MADCVRTSAPVCVRGLISNVLEKLVAIISAVVNHTWLRGRGIYNRKCGMNEGKVGEMRLRDLCCYWTHSIQIGSANPC